MRVRLYPYNSTSMGAKSLSEKLGVLRCKRKNSKFKGRRNDVIINWGCSNVPKEVIGSATILNKPECVYAATNKLLTFQTLNAAGVRVPQFTDCRLDAERWLSDGKSVVERHKLRSSNGRGVVIKEKGQVLGDCPLYVQYVPKKQEWRVHVVAGVVIATQRKARKLNVPDDKVNWKIRSHDRGFTFARNEGLAVPEDVLAQGVAAVKALGLDMGAVDVVFNEKQQKAYVLEVNTACGLEGETVNDYAKALSKLIKGL